MSLSVYIILIFLFTLLYVYVDFTHNPVTKSDIIRRQQHDIRVLQKKLARKKTGLVAVVLLFLMIAPMMTQNPAILSINSGAPSIVDEQQVIEDFSIPSADGDISTDSITSFSETLADDVLFYPDTFNWTEYADSGISSPSSSWTYTNTYTKNSAYWVSYDSSASGPWETSAEFTIDIPSALKQAPDGADISIWLAVVDGDSNSKNYNLSVYDYDSSSWDMLQTDVAGLPEAWNNFSLTDEKYFASNITLKIESKYVTVAGNSLDIWIDCIEVDFSGMTLADDGHYAESFADVSDWVNWGMDASDSWSSDGDILSMECEQDGGSGNDNDAIRKSLSSVISANSYWEYRVNLNTTNYDYVRLFVYENADWTGSYTNIPVYGTGWQTIKKIVLHAVQSIKLIVKLTDAKSGPVNIQSDYVRGSPSNEMGWQHDGSTTQGVTALPAGGGTVSGSDGDYVSLVADADNSAFLIPFDTTATAATLEDTYYSFLEIQFHTGDEGDVFNLETYDGTSYTQIDYQTISATGLYRWNIGAVEDDPVRLQITIYSSSTVRFDYIKFYSIANFTVTQAASVGEYLYVDSGVLKGYAADDVTWFSLGLDTQLSVDVATYNVWNLTVNEENPTANDDYGVNFYVGGSWGTERKDTTRGSYTLTGTLTDLTLRVYSSISISAIKFIEDSTAPSVVRTNNAPATPDTSSTVTLSSVVTDTIEVYKVYFDAISYPSGFSDIAYYATEASDNLWTYTFSSTLPEGYYCFKVVATDGANENDLTSDSYVDFTIEQERITTYIRIFDSLGDWVPFETFEVYRNSSRQYTDTFSSYTDEAWQIQVKDRFGATLNTTTFSAGTEELIVIVNIHSLKIQNWYEDYVFFNLTRSGITYREVIAPLEIVDFKLYENTYTWLVDYRNGTTVNGETTLTSSTCIVVTGSTIADVVSYSQSLIDMTTAINVTITSTNNQVLTISVNLDNVNATINDQLIQVLLNITNTNSTIFDQTVDLLAYLQNVNSTLYAQTAAFIVNVYNNQTTIYDQTVSLLSNLQNMNSTIYAQTLSI
ncbi:MAG: hypothetical protein ACTSPB_13640, partial [Candidatus Thorarchaeota archaeon]